MKTTNRNTALLRLAIGGLLSVAATHAHADDGANKGLFEALRDWGIKVGGWANAGITYNSTDPENNFNGPVTFNDRSGEFQLNQLNGFVEKATVSEGSAWDFGMRFDVMFGTDAVFTQAFGGEYGNWDYGLLGGDRFYNLAVPQAYADIYAPIGNGLKLKVGRFYTPLGYETVPAPDNFFYSHDYAMQFGQPFTHTGVQGNYGLDKNWSLMGGVVTGSQFGGWDGNFQDQLGNWAGMAGATWTSNDAATSLNVAGTYGAISETNPNSWALYTVVLKQDITDRFHVMLEHDQGFAEQFAPGGVNANWYGINSHFIYDIRDDLKAGIRAEWFRDHNGVRVCYPARTLNCPGIPGTYYQVTAGLIWKPKEWLSLRPNVRYDWAEGVRPFDVDAAGIGHEDDQFLFSTDAIVTF